MKVINLFGGPGVGKSTLASSLFSFMKTQGENVEYAPEYAKDMVYEHRDNILADQLYILAKQNRRLTRLAENGVEWAITDGPLALGLVYGAQDSQALINMVIECHTRFDNYNFFLERSKYIDYQPDGRVQKTLEEALAKDAQIKDTLKLFEGFHLKCTSFRVGYDSAGTLMWDLGNMMKAKEKKAPV